MAPIVSCHELKASIDKHIKNPGSANNYRTTINKLESNGIDDMVTVYSDPLNVAKILKSKGIQQESCAKMFKHLKSIMTNAIIDQDIATKFSNINHDFIMNYSKLVIPAAYNDEGDSDDSSVGTDMDASEFLSADAVIKDSQITKQNMCDNVRKLKTDFQQMLNTLNALREQSSTHVYDQDLSHRLEHVEKQLSSFGDNVISMKKTIDTLTNLISIIALSLDNSQSKELLKFTLQKTLKLD